MRYEFAPILGKTVEEAKDKLSEVSPHLEKIRVVRKDGKDGMVAMNLNVRRVNVELAGDLIVRVVSVG